MERFDVLIIGAGLSGAAAAAELSRTHKVALLEAEARPGYHSSGRSGGVFGQVYGSPMLRQLCRAARSTLFSPPDELAQRPFVNTIGAMIIANCNQMDRLEELARDPEVAAFASLIGLPASRRLCPLLRDDYVVASLHDPAVASIDVDALHQAYLRMLRRNGGALFASLPLRSAEYRTGQWQVNAGERTFQAATLINAAGAWADEVAIKAGVEPLGITALRRTAILVEPPSGSDIRRMPVVLDLDDQFYFKEEAGLLMLSPADETPVAPCDARPEEIDIAMAVHRVNEAAEIPVRVVRHAWAGLRSFTADRDPVIGRDPGVPQFVWIAGEGGHGIATAPALGRIAAAIACNEDLPADLAALGLSLQKLGPGRLRR